MRCLPTGRGRGRDPLEVERGRHCSRCLEDRHRIQGAEQGHIQHVESKGPDAGMDVESDKGRDLVVTGYQGPDSCVAAVLRAHHPAEDEGSAVIAFIAPRGSACALR